MKEKEVMQQGAPSIEAARAMGETGGPVVEAERLAFEAWMAGHHWAVSQTWDGKQYDDRREYREAKPQMLDPLAMHTRQLWAAWRDRAALASLAKPDDKAQTFQQRVKPWLLACFGDQIAGDKIERNHRFLEESLELVQACGCTQAEAHQLVDYVYGRPVGEANQEVGGVMMTLAALCLAQGLDMHAAGETELARVWTKVEQIRAKQAAKPRNSPLPAAPQPPAEQDDAAELLRKVKEIWLEWYDGHIKSAGEAMAELSRVFRTVYSGEPPAEQGAELVLPKPDCPNIWGGAYSEKKVREIVAADRKMRGGAL